MASKETIKDEKELSGKAQDWSAKTADPGVTVPADESGFPAKYAERSALERRLKLKQDIVQSLNVQDKNLRANYQVSDADVDILEQKDRARELFQFENWLASWCNLDDPVYKKWIKDHYPAFFERRLALLDETLANQRRVARLRITGPEGADDLYFQYLYENGDIQIYDKAVFDTSGYEADFERGLLNVKRWAKDMGRVGTPFPNKDARMFKGDGKPGSMSGGRSATPAGAWKGPTELMAGFFGNRKNPPPWGTGT